MAAVNRHTPFLFFHAIAVSLIAAWSDPNHQSPSQLFRFSEFHFVLETNACGVKYVFNTYKVLEAIGMHKKLTITLDSKVYYGLRKVVGPRRISQFIEDLVRPHVSGQGLEKAYQKMSQDEAREAAALEWSEAFVEDLGDESR